MAGMKFEVSEGIEENDDGFYGVFSTMKMEENFIISFSLSTV